jgi:hypothetical protein
MRLVKYNNVVWFSCLSVESTSVMSICGINVCHVYLWNQRLSCLSAESTSVMSTCGINVCHVYLWNQRLSLFSILKVRLSSVNVYLIQLYVIKITVTCCRFVVFSEYSTFLRLHSNIIEILLKVKLNTNKPIYIYVFYVAQDIVKTGFAY